MCKQQRNSFISITFFFIIISLIVTQARCDCLTSWGAPGKCVPLKDCPKISKILQMKPLSPISEKNVVNAICGIDGLNYKVCCTTAQNLHAEEKIVNPPTTESPQLYDNNANESCISSTGREGNCVNINKCDEMMNLLKQKPISEENRNYLQRSHCGYEGIVPKVCCETQVKKNSENLHNSEEIKSSEIQENCISQSGKNENCVDIRECPKLMNLLQQKPLTPEIRSYLRGSQCGWNHNYPKVCCDGEIEDEENGDKNQSILVEDCETPRGRMGKCISINDCENLRKLYREEPLSPMGEKILENARCSRENIQDSKLRVCCEVKHLRFQITPRDSRITMRSIVQELSDNHPNLRLLSHNDCGPFFQSRIVGGSDTRLHEFPWMARLGYNVSKEEIEYECGGTVISEKYILTAAHCVPSPEDGKKLIRVRLGEYDIKTDKDCDNKGNCNGKYKDFEIEYTKTHENWSPETYHNDIGLVKLKSPINFRSGYIRPICLPLYHGNSTRVMKNLKNVIVTGWGVTESGVKSMRLRKVTIRIVTNEECQRVYKHKKNVIISHKQMCAGGDRDKDSCSGDSGGPLQAIGMYGNRPSFIQYGIVSFGYKECGIQGYPAIYTRVADYIEWILDNMTN